MEELFAIVDEISCTNPDCPNPDTEKALKFKEPRRVPCLVNVICPFCETILRQEVFEEDIPELRHAGH